MKRNSRKFPRIIIDTSTLFSAIYTRKGNEAKLLEYSEFGRCEIVIFDYVIEEIESIFQRNGLDIELVYDLLDNYQNITVSSLENIKEEEISLALKVIDDPLDRPIFIFAKRIIDSSEFSFFVSGDKGFFKKDALNELSNRTIHTIEAIEILSKT